MHGLGVFVSYVVVALAAVVKLPQIFKMLQSRSACGLNLSSVYMGTLAALAGTAYHLHNGSALRAYGELGLILVQNVVIVLLCWAMHPKHDAAHVASVMAAFAVAVGCMWQLPVLETVWPARAVALGLGPLNMLYNVTTALSLCSRVPQILQNFQQHHTGVLSLGTLCMFVFGNVARLGTSLQEGFASVVVWSFVLNFVMNVVLLAQVMWYWSATEAVMRKAPPAGSGVKAG